MPAQAQIWTDQYQVRSYEVDAEGSARLTTLCNYLQESAGNHAAHLGVSVEHLLEKNMTWVLSKLHIQVARYPSWKDVIKLETWPSGHNGLLASREFRLSDEAGNPFAVASTAWLLVDIRRLRPLRIPPFIDEIRTPSEELPIPDPFPRLNLPDAPSHERKFEVRHQDIDMNGHANNVSFIGWGLEVLTGEHLASHLPAACEIQFKAEAALGQTVRSSANLDGETANHGLFVEEEKGKEIARMRTQWRPR